MSDLSDLWADSQSSGKLFNIVATDYGDEVKKAVVSIGNVGLNIHRRGQRKKRERICHDPQVEAKIYQLFAQLKNGGNFWASLRNFKEKILMNFTAADFARGLYFVTLTFNSQNAQLEFTRAPWSDGQCFFSDCQGQHFYQPIDPAISSFLAEKKIAKKVGRELEGVGDLFAAFIRSIYKKFRPANFKWVAVAEPHKCQVKCHWKGQKSQKKGWKNHREENCRCVVRHECERNWHIHLLCSDFLPPHLQHERCGLELGRGCHDHRFIIAHELWPWGMADIKKVEYLRNSHGRAVKTAEALVSYLAKYLGKNFQLRHQQPELAAKMGLLPGMGVYKFFRVIYGYYQQGEQVLSYIADKIKKPEKIAATYINNSPTYRWTAERELAGCFESDKNGNCQLKKNLRQVLKTDEPVKKGEKISPVQLIKKCCRYASRSAVKVNQAWRPCQIEEGQIACQMVAEHHTENIVRWEFTFRGKEAYAAWQAFIKPLISQVNLPQFTKFPNYRPTDEHFAKFDDLARCPWNSEISNYVAYTCDSGGWWDDSEWRQTVPREEIYNWVYLREIRGLISNGYRAKDYGLDYAAAAKRYADY